jgi:CBS domain-containing protein
VRGSANHAKAPEEPTSTEPSPTETSLVDALGSFISPHPPLRPDTPVFQAYETFSATPALYALAVVDADGSPIGLLNRFKFLETLSRPFGRDLLRHQTVAAAMDASPLVVDEHMPLDQLSSLLADDTSKYVFDGFIVTRTGRYLGIGTGFSLIRVLTERKQAALFHLAHHDSLTGL